MNADLPDLCTGEVSQATVPSYLLITSHRPDIVVYDSETSTVALLELTCPLDSKHHIQAAIDLGSKIRPSCLQNLIVYRFIMIMKQCMEISVLGHYQPSCIQKFKSFSDFIQPSVTTKSSI